MSIFTAAGEISLTPHGFSKLLFKFPLKLMPAFSRFIRTTNLIGQDVEHPEQVITLGLAYILSYGGGLVGGDEITLAVEVSPFCCLTLLTQGNTKVFKKRPARGLDNKTTMQAMTCSIAPDASLVLLPSPVTCFAEATYNQYQRFVIECSKTSNLILLDSITSGRASRGEVWQFESYYSLNEIWHADTDQRAARDAVLLKRPGLTLEKMVYDTYATLFLYGQRTDPIVDHYKSMQEDLFKHATAPDFLWSLSVLDSGCAIVRAAGQSPEVVKDFFRDTLRAGGLESWLGQDVFRNAWA